METQTSTLTQSLTPIQNPTQTPTQTPPQPQKIVQPITSGGIVIDSLCAARIEGGGKGDPQVPPKVKIVLKLKPGAVLPVKPVIPVRLNPGSTHPPIILPEYQETHVKSLTEILDRRPTAIDLSMLGSGKTYTASYLALHKFNHVIVVCPLSLKPKWTYMKTHHGVPIHTIETYNGIRAVKCRQPKCGLLSRLDYTQTITNSQGTPVQIDKVEFKPTALLQKLLTDRTLIVIDEFQHVKNISAQFMACQALIEAIVGPYQKDPASMNSRAILMSGSPVDKFDQVTHIFRLIGIMRSPKLSQPNPYTGENTWLGFLDIYTMTQDILRLTGAKTDIQFPPINTGSASDFKMIVYDVFQTIIKPRISSSMKMVHLPVKIHKFNGFYDILDKDDATLLSEGIHKLGRALSYTDDAVHFGADAINTLGQVTTALQIIETAKISTMVRIATSQLEFTAGKGENPRGFSGKVVICVNYTQTILDLKERLSAYNPLILNGKTRDRDTIIKQLAADTDEHRLLIGNLQVCSSGIDLDDKFGGRPRFVIVSPNYSTISLYQLSHRFVRMDSKSDATIHMLYGKHECELKILQALATKSTVMKETTHVQVESGVVFPCDYPAYVEPGGGRLNRDLVEYLADA